MEYTGERFVPDQHGNIELEHLHRYLCALDLCGGKDVLDIASGEGYGSSLLAGAARSVIGVDIAEDAVVHAQQRYRADNLEYRVGSAASIPVGDSSVDVVVSFETIEHHDQHDEMMAEIKRVLRPGGFLIMSSPDKRVYSEISGFSNPYHIKELTRDEFVDLLGRYFRRSAIYGQRVAYGSVLLAENLDTRTRGYAKHDGRIECAQGLVDPMYLIAVASDADLPKLTAGIFEAGIHEADVVVELQRVIAACQHEISEFRQGRDALEAAFSQVRRDNESVLVLAEQRRQALDEMERELNAQREQSKSRGDQLQDALSQLEALQRGRDVARAALDVALREVSGLRAEGQELRESVARLSGEVGRLNESVQAYRRSFSWRLTAPVRFFTSMLRQSIRIVLIPLRIVRALGRSSVVPVKHLRAENGRYVSTGDDPQFAVCPNWRGFAPGWAMVTLEMRTDEAFPRPVIYAFAGEDGKQTHAYPISDSVNGTIKRLIVLPPDVRSMRFDPTDRAGITFELQKLTVRPLDKVGLAYEGWRVLDATRRRAVIGALARRQIDRAKTILRDAVVGKYDRDAYQTWVAEHDTLTKADLARYTSLGDALPVKPLISILMPVYNSRPKYLRKALDSVRAQTYRNWELCIADDASTNPEVRAVLEEYAGKDDRIRVVFREKNGHISAASNSALEIVRGEFVALMDHDDAMPAHALYMIASEINAHPDADLIYTDEDKVDENDRRHDPHFKTDWNRELFYSQNFVAHLGVYRTSIARAIGGFRVGFEGSQDYDFVLRFLPHTQENRIRHIPRVLYHWRIFPGVTSFSTDNPDKSVSTARRALIEYFREVEPTSEVQPIERFPGWWRIKRMLPEKPPRVSLIVPTRDRLDVLRVAVNGFLHETDYPDFEVIIVDNDSERPETLEYFSEISRDPRVRILRVSGPFNFSELNNRAVEISTGSILGFMNNDIQVIHSDWLAEMVSQISQRNVGAVGAKLIYANEHIQHAGVVLGIYGVAAHGHRHFPRDTVGYFGRPMLVQNVSAVTAACMLVRREAFDRAGGYDEVNLTVGYNDVDLCLKIREAGYDIVYTPFAELYHLESVSRGENLSAAQIERDAKERAYMRSRWSQVIDHDPFYNPNLTVTSEDYSLAFPPRTDNGCDGGRE
ncbi:glycosyltransferase [Burkholderia territorii]|uniref:glycosyltransferase n=1 Tax=Burkholderia territorii TaxID=1503055 RepID=UPI0009C09EF7|nr:glycosyltransferase [Burkholderia territorii]TXG24444.1 glycosyltransferase [Burkholderia territorii]HDR8857321.1 glycosyltransferase [Burkholderia territorii]HDR8863965.1 glycosyltransferase [Burkholderia territorii]HDR8868699.1 glycosyltransferase [Burkholderia territorii]HDR8875258.1 glycosyltransferase [Burkholderia territorii]